MARPRRKFGLKKEQKYELVPTNEPVQRELEISNMRQLTADVRRKGYGCDELFQHAIEFNMGIDWLRKEAADRIFGAIKPPKPIDIDIDGPKTERAWPFFDIVDSVRRNADSVDGPHGKSQTIARRCSAACPTGSASFR